MYKIIGGDNQEYGPITADELRQWISEGRANLQTLVRAEGGMGWKPLSQFPELLGASSTPPPLAKPAVTQGNPPPIPPFTPKFGATTRPNIPSYLVPAILCTLCCCLPGGIVAIVYAAQVGSKLAVGDIAGAEAASKSARTWCWVCFVVGALLIVGYAVIIAFMGSIAGRSF